MPRSARRAPARLLLAAAAAVAGCSWSRTVLNDPSAADRAEAVVPGATRGDDLPAILGSAPLSVVEAGEGRRLHVWAWGETKSKGFNLVVVAFGRSNTGLDTAYFLVDREGVVRGKWVGSNSRDLPWEWWPFGE